MPSYSQIQLLLKLYFQRCRLQSITSLPQTQIHIRPFSNSHINVVAIISFEYCLLLSKSKIVILFFFTLAEKPEMGITNPCSTCNEAEEQTTSSKKTGSTLKWISTWTVKQFIHMHEEEEDGQPNLGTLRRRKKNSSGDIKKTYIKSHERVFFLKMKRTNLHIFS